MAGYAELQVTTNFSFLQGGSHPEEFVRAAKALGLSAIGIADRNTLAGVVRAHSAAKEAGLNLLVGARLDLADSAPVLCYPMNREAYGRLSRLLTLGKRRAAKGECDLRRADLMAYQQGQILVVLPPERPDEAFANLLRAYRHACGDRVYVALSHRYQGDDARRFAEIAEVAARADIPLLATNDVHYHHPGRRALQDVLTCIREGCTVDDAGWRLLPNAERHLKAPQEIARLFKKYAQAIDNTIYIARRCDFSLDELRYEYPSEVCHGQDPQTVLESLSWAGAARRYPAGVPAKVSAQLEYELSLIKQLGYAPYFLTVQDVVAFAQDRGILCQGRGSAANSSVCYCLGITAVDPAKSDLLFERFISAERNEPPDIDVDFEHERREEVIQYIYEKYGRHRAALTATVNCYRARGAIREVGKALGLSLDTVGLLAASIWGWGQEAIDTERVREQGLDPADPRLAMALDLSRELVGFPRHLSQHVGGFVISDKRVDALCPVMNAAMPQRTTIEWDKDDIEALGMLKVDILALGMLSCLRRAFDLIETHHGRRLTLASVPPEDKATYDMLCRADSLGVFQVESRAQMNMLPRLRPQTFYDLVIEVAIVRPGPIQGDMVHPYLRRRNGEEPVTYPSDALRAVLGRTMGVPLFQEQAMKIAIVAAGFTPSEADRLRRAMATFKKVGIIHEFRDKLIEGMIANGYDPEFAERCFKQIEGFGTYGFPESHAASFALLVYISAWIKCHYPAVFCAALLNSQPMGFYAPAQIVRDAREHGVAVLPPDINHSTWDTLIEDGAVRLGLRQVKGLSAADMQRLVAARGNRPFADIEDLWRRTGLRPAVFDTLAKADAYRSIGLDRRAASWAVKALRETPVPADAPLLSGLPQGDKTDSGVALPPMPLGEHVVNDFASLHLSLKAHPMALLRPAMRDLGYHSTADLTALPDRARVHVAGLVLVRQRPGSAKGVVFVTIEDEAGIANLVILPDRFEAERKALLGARLMGAQGRIERAGEIIHVRIERLTDLSDYLKILSEDEGAEPKRKLQRHPRDTAPLLDYTMARADEVKSPTPDQREVKAAKAAFPEGRNFR